MKVILDRLANKYGLNTQTCPNYIKRDPSEQHSPPEVAFSKFLLHMSYMYNLIFYICFGSSNFDVTTKFSPHSGAHQELKTVDLKQNSTTNFVAYFGLGKWIWWHIFGFTTESTRVTLKDNYPTNLMVAYLGFSKGRFINYGRRGSKNWAQFVSSILQSPLSKWYRNT